MEKFDTSAVLRPVQLYVDGYFTGNAEFLKQAFTEDAVMNGFVEGAFLSSTISEYIQGISQNPSAEERNIPFETAIESVRVCGKTAVVTITETNYAGCYNFWDCFQLILSDEGWKITAKLFTTID